MSANGKAGIKGLNKREELVVTFRSEPDGSYTKFTKKMTRDRTTGAIKYYVKGNPVIEEGPYVVTDNADDSDEILQYEGFSGEKIVVYLKKQ